MKLTASLPMHDFPEVRGALGVVWSHIALQLEQVGVDRAVPVRIRQALNVESGLNDGIALTFVLVFAALASASQEPVDALVWLSFGLKQITFRPVAGVVVGYTGAKLVALSHRKG